MPEIDLRAKPRGLKFDPAKTALILIDVQKDFVYKGGYGEQLGNDPLLLQKVIAPCRKLLDVWRENGWLVIHTREGHLPDLSDCPKTKLNRWPAGTRIGDKGPMGRILIRGEEGHAIVEELAPKAGEIEIDKPGKNSFYRTNLDDILRKHGIETVIICGVTTDVCCFTTMTAANDHGYDAVILEDCVASYSPARHAAALDILSAQGGIFGFVSDSTAVLAAVSNASAKV